MNEKYISSVASSRCVKDGNPKKIGVKEKEAYASSFEFVFVILDFLTHEGIVSDKMVP